LNQTKKTITHENRVRGNKQDRSTSQQVMDGKTKQFLLSLLNANILSAVHGVINTGKEANVYLGNSGTKTIGSVDGRQVLVDLPTKRDYAIKIFKTTLNEFKNRTQYMEGEYRFRDFKSKGNYHKLVKMWAEKEMRNLKRMKKAGIPCPSPIILKDNVLIMTLIGSDGKAAPMLKNIQFKSYDKLQSAYLQCVTILKKLYDDCKMIHADFSEYNLLYDDQKVVVIDVSQAVDVSHPSSMEFLKKDCEAIATYFAKQGIEGAVSWRQLFEFVVDPNRKSVEEFIETTTKKNLENPTQTNTEIVNDNVFKQLLLPQNLKKVEDPNPNNELIKDFHKLVSGIQN